MSKMGTEKTNAVQICNKTVTLNTIKDLKDIMNTGRMVNSCPFQVPCNQFKIGILAEKTEKTVKTQTKFLTMYVWIASPMIEHVIDSYSYDFLGLFGECGGTLGLLLGLSCLSLIDVILQYGIVSMKSLFRI
jgi:hypothetical protein